jgi:hypothetical protein
VEPTADGDRPIAPTDAPGAVSVEAAI